MDVSAKVNKSFEKKVSSLIVFRQLKLLLIAGEHSAVVDWRHANYLLHATL